MCKAQQMNINKKDSTPHRPCRRTSAFVSMSGRLETVVEEENIFTLMNLSYNSHFQSDVTKDTPPKKPCHASRSTSTTSSDEAWDLDSEFDSSTFELELEMDEATKAREQPNLRTRTIPIDETSSMTLQKRKGIVEDFWRVVNDNQTEAIRTFCTQEYQYIECGTDKKTLNAMSLDETIDAASILFDSMPDFHCMYRVIEESCDEPGVLVLHGFVFAGTHTGAPFVVGDKEPIQPSGKALAVDECEVQFYFDPLQDNKICRTEEIAMGELTGMSGTYALLAEL